MAEPLRIAPTLALPLDAVTETFAILAVKRAGKSNAAVVMAEEMYDAGVPWVAIDPKGDWWGLRAAGDGEAPGLSVLVFGGLHGDVPLEPGGGRLVADLIVEQRITCVLDVSEMTKADQRRFLIDFADRLYRRNTEPLHVFCEEADEYIPQRVTGEVAKLVGAFETLVKRGGFRGIGITLITQRSASLNKDVLTQAGTLIAMRTPSPQDRKAVLAWIDYHQAGREVVDELPMLEAGEAWVFSPQWLRTLQKIRFRRRRTFDSGATPKVGGKPRPPARLADVDLAVIKEQMADTIEKAKADDPKELRKQIAVLKRELATRPTAEPEHIVETVIEKVEVPVLDEALVARLEAALGPAADLLDRLSSVQANIVQAARDDARAAPRPPQPAPRPVRLRATPAPATASAGGDVDAMLGKAERAFLTVLAQYPAGRTRDQVAIFAGYSVKSRHIDNTLAALRSAAYIEGGRDHIQVTDPGLVALGVWEPLPTGPALVAHFKARFLGKAAAEFLDVVLAVHPGTITRDEIAERAGYSVQSRHVDNTLAQLRSLQLVSGGRDAIRLNDEFAEAIT